MPLDIHVKSYLRQHFGLPEEQIELMLPDFKKTLSQHMNALASAHQQGDLSVLKDAAHTMKGALLNLGFSDTAELAQKIEMESAACNRTIDYSLLIDSIRAKVIEFADE